MFLPFLFARYSIGANDVPVIRSSMVYRSTCITTIIRRLTSMCATEGVVPYSSSGKEFSRRASFPSLMDDVSVNGRADTVTNFC